MNGKDPNRSLEKLRRSRKVLESRVQERTTELIRVNEALQAVIAEHKRAEQELFLLLSIIEAVCDCKDFNSAIKVTLQKVCETTGWQYAEVWIPRADGTALECSPVWFGRNKRVEEFRKSSESLMFAPGSRLPGFVWASKKPQWIQEVSAEPDTRYQRAELAKAAGLKAALGLPIVVGDDVMAVLVFYQQERRARQRRLVDLVSAVGAHLGSVIKHTRADQALLENQALLSAIMDNSSRVIYLKDLHGRYLSVNRQYENLFHVKREEIKGKSDHDLFPKELADAFRANDLKVAEAGTPLEFEETVQQDDGLHTYISNKFPMFDAAGLCYAVCGISTDITERKRMVEDEIAQRRKAESWLERLIETTQDGVISIDPQGHIVLFNPAAEKIFGYAQAEVEGKRVNLLMAEPYASKHDFYLDRYEESGEPRAIGRIRTVEGRRKSGEVFPIELSVTEVATGEDVRYAAFIRDVSEKTGMQEKLIESERLAAIGSASAAFAHEIGNPLNGMSMTVQLLERRLGRLESLDEGALSTVQRLKDEIHRLNSLLQEFASFSRREKYSFKPVSLAAIAGEVFSMELVNYIAHGIQIEPIFPPDLPLVFADRDKLKQALLNLCKNAVEAMPDGGELKVNAYSSGNEVTLDIIDSGVGIPEGMNIFEPFATTKASGTGLGLMIVRQIISAHGGMVTYTSERGKGTLFRITLPVTTS